MIFDRIIKHVLKRCHITILIDIFINDVSISISTNPTGNLFLMPKNVNNVPIYTLIRQLIDIIQDESLYKTSTNLTKLNECIFIQSCAYGFLEILYERCPLNILKTTITYAYLGLISSQTQLSSDSVSTATVTGKELTTILSKVAYKCIRNSITNVYDYNLQYRLHTSAYNCLAMFVSRTQTEERFFEMLLFHEKVSINECLWENIINCIQQYEFNCETEPFEEIVFGCQSNDSLLNLTSPPTTASNTNTRGLSMTQDRFRKSFSSKNDMTKSIKSINNKRILSQYLSSSLVTSSSIMGRLENKSARPSQYTQKQSQAQLQSQQQYTQAQSQQQQWTQQQSQLQSQRQMSSTDNTNLLEGLDDQMIVLELNHLNTEVCMKSLLRAITRMSVLFKSQWQHMFMTTKTLPKWLETCKDLLTDYRPLQQTHYYSLSATNNPSSSSTTTNATKGSSGISVNNTTQESFLEKIPVEYERRNIRLFILRLLLNQPIASIIAPAIVVLLEPILTCCLHDLCSNNIPTTNSPTNMITPSYNYFLRDIVYTLCYIWNDLQTLTSFPPTCAVKITQFLSYILQVIYNQNATILNDNKKSFRILIDIWYKKLDGGFLQYPIHITSILILLESEFSFTGGRYAAVTSTGTVSVRKIQTGLELLTILLQASHASLLLVSKTIGSNRLLEEDSLNDSNKNSNNVNRLLQSVKNCLRYPRKEVQQSASRVCGLIQTYIRQFQSLTTSSITSSSSTTITNINSNLSSGLYDMNTYMLHEKCDDFANEVDNIIITKRMDKMGYNNMATCISSLTSTDKLGMTRDMFTQSISFFKRMSTVCKYEFLKAIVETQSPYIADIDIIDKFRQFILSILLNDITTIAIGRGYQLKRVPVIQLYTIKLLVKYVTTLSINFMYDILFSEHFNLILNIKTYLSVRREGYKFLLGLYEHPVIKPYHNNFKQRQVMKQSSSSSGSSSSNISSNNEKVEEKEELLFEIYQKLTMLVLKGLSDPDDSDEVVEEESIDEEQDNNDSDGINISYSSTTNNASNKQYMLSIRQQVFQFIDENYGLSYDPFQRLQTLMTDLYQPTTSQQWVHYSTQLLLTLCRNTHEFQSNIFTRSLSQDNNYAPLDMTPYVTTMNAKTTQSAMKGSMLGSSTNILLDTQAPLFSLDRISNTQLLHPVDQNKIFSSSSMVKGTQQKQWTIDNSQKRNLSTSSQYQSSQHPSQMIIIPYTSQIQTNALLSQIQPAGMTSTTSSHTNFAPTLGTYFGGSQPFKSSTSARPVILTTQQVPCRYKAFPSSTNANSTTNSTTSSGSKYPSKSGKAGTSKDGVKYHSEAGQQYTNIKQQEESQRNKVSLSRQYRQGELPDIQITMADIINPLITLCSYDTVLATQMICELYKTLYNCCNTNNDLKEAPSTNTMTTEQLDQTLRQMLQNVAVTSDSSSSCIKFVLTSSLLTIQTKNIQLQSASTYSGVSLDPHTSQKTKKSKLQQPSSSSSSSPSLIPSYMDMTSLQQFPYEIITGLAISSLNYHTGIQIIEELLLVYKKLNITNTSLSTTSVIATMPTTTTTNLTTNSINQLWKQLSRLYESLGDTDTLLILAMKLTTSTTAEDTKSAIDAESQHNYEEAIKIYKSLIEKTNIIINQQSNRHVAMQDEDSDNSENPGTYESDSESSRNSQDSSNNPRQKRHNSNNNNNNNISNEIEDIQLWNNRSLECYKQLSDWSGLHSKLEDIVIHSSSLTSSSSHNDNNFWEQMLTISSQDTSFRNHYLPYYIQSCIYYIPAPETTATATAANNRDAKIQENYTRFFDVCIQNPVYKDIKKWLESHCIYELSLTYAWKLEWGKVLYFNNLCYQSFLTQWNLLHPCATEAKKHLLTTLEPILELNDIAQLYNTNISSSTNISTLSSLITSSSTSSNSNNNRDMSNSTAIVPANSASSSTTTTNSKLEYLLRKWCRTLPSPLDPSYIWSKIATCRKIGLYEKKVSETEDLINLYLSDFHRSSAFAAICQGNLQVCINITSIFVFICV